MLNGKKIADILTSGKAESLDSDVEIEDIVAVLGDLEKKTDFLKRLKKNRTSTIDEEIQKIEIKKQLFKDVIKETLTKFGHKSLNFPGVGKVQIRNSSGSWEILDEEELTKFLASTLDASDYCNVVKSQPSLVKKELNKVLDQLKADNKLPSSVRRTPDLSGISVSYDAKIDEKSEEVLNNLFKDKNKEEKVDNTTFDGIDF